MGLFIKGRNSFHRICKLCGGHQQAYCRAWNWTNDWWEEVYPVGNNPNCRCHKFAVQEDI